MEKSVKNRFTVNPARTYYENVVPGSLSVCLGMYTYPLYLPCRLKLNALRDHAQALTLSDPF